MITKLFLGANFYPLLGCYSSKNPVTVAQHMKWIRQAGIGVLVISWYPPDSSKFYVQVLYFIGKK
jgi:glycoprotein endo-alpha-1,2-mannosidase